MNLKRVHAILMFSMFIVSGNSSIAIASDLASPNLGHNSVDLRKSAIELPVKSLLNLGTSPVPAASSPVPPHSSHLRKESNYVKPGLVAWHGSLDAAKQASKKSHKPVFVFQMMGRLDDRFC